MGRVFLGRSAGGRPVAVKVIRSEFASDPDFRGRFRREVAAARRVNGLFTAMVVDADLDAEEPWLATAYVPGPSLAEAVRDHGPLPTSSVLALTAGLAESLAAIHAADVVHRDLKPPNVLLAEDGPRVIDFGISRAAEATSMTRAGFVIGSPGFMSPEQAEGGEIGPASDIFSLGAVLVYAATGESPFGSGMTAALVYRVVHGAPRLGGVPALIRPLIERCLAKDPGERPTVSDLLAVAEVEADVFQSTAGWLPEPIMSAFPDRPAPAIAQPLPPVAESSPVPGAAVGEGELTGAGSTITGRAPFITPEPEGIPPEPEAASPDAETVPADAETIPPDAETIPPDAETIPPDAETIPPDAETIPPDAETIPPDAETVLPDVTAVPLEPEAVPSEAEAETVPVSDPAAVTEAEAAVPVLDTVTPEPVSAAADVVAGPQSGPDLTATVLPLRGSDSRRQWRHPRRSMVLGAAAALILIASASTALALGAPGHTSASPPQRTAAAVIPSPTAAQSAQPTTPGPSPSPSGPKSRPRGSARPSPHPTTAAPTTQSPTPRQAPTTSAPASTHAPTPKPTPKHTPTPTTLSVSGSGASQQSCGEIGSVKSSDGATVSYTFVNHSSVDIQVAAIDSSGAVEVQATIEPGGESGASASVGSYWVVENSGGGCLAVFEIEGAGQATVT
jgi:eukaryotic-like serine/threonine-protein kinase